MYPNVAKTPVPTPKIPNEFPILAVLYFANPPNDRMQQIDDAK